MKEAAQLTPAEVDRRYSKSAIFMGTKATLERSHRSSLVQPFQDAARCDYPP